MKQEYIEFYTLHHPLIEIGEFIGRKESHGSISLYGESSDESLQVSVVDMEEGLQVTVEGKEIPKDTNGNAKRTLVIPPNFSLTTNLNEDKQSYLVAYRRTYTVIDLINTGEKKEAA